MLLGKKVGYLNTRKNQADRKVQSLIKYSEVQLEREKKKKEKTKGSTGPRKKHSESRDRGGKHIRRRSSQEVGRGGAEFTTWGGIR